MKKNNAASYIPKTLLAALTVALIFLLLSCQSYESTSPEPDPVPESPPADTAAAVAPDGVLETVTWNIENYDGSRTTTDNAVKIVDSLDADLYAFQEISGQEALDKLTGRMKGYRGFVADYITYDQKLAFAYNTQTINSLAFGSITKLQDEYDWAGRLPFYFKFKYSYRNTTIPIYAIVIHGKANTGNKSEQMEAYNRRQRAARSLHQYLLKNKPKANIIFLGDYNDDMDISIYEGRETPYQPFVGDNDDFRVITKILSEEGQASTTGYPDTIDHITISNEMEAYYIANSAMRFKPTSNFIKSYETTTSDHYPVFAKFDISQ